MLPSEIVEQGWTKGANARNENGVITDMDHDNARFLCARSAVLKAFKNDSSMEIIYIRKIYDKTNCMSLTTWNDNSERTKEEVIQLFQEIEKEMNLV